MESIALTIGVHKSTISRELKRNSTANGKYVWKEAKSLAKTVWRLLLPYKGDALKTITTDNGSEFAEHEWITKKLGVPVYFVALYCSWQKEAVENGNKLIRQYIIQGNRHKQGYGWENQ